MSPGAIAERMGASSRVDVLLAKQGRADKLHLRRRVEFRLASQPDAKMDQLRKKYQPINAAGSGHQAKANGAQKQPAPPSDGLEDDSGFRRAVHSLFPDERLSTGWRTVRPIGPGLANLGNTCFLNSVLQCLTYTPPLAEHMLAREHSGSCRAGDNCMLCRFEAHVARALSKRDSATIAPKAIVGRLRSVAKHMRVGRQEDAHEFLRLLVEAFQRSLLAGIDAKIDRRIQETTLAHRIFGGYLQSQVSCSRCGHDSNTFDPLLDISLDIHSGSSVARALRAFARPETLAKDNRYQCEKCRRLVDATKQMTVYQLPRVLTLQLKRFSAFGGGKINRFVEFPLRLDMKSYISKNSPEAGPYDYNLYAVLVHAGGTARSGHYYCFVKAPAGVWYELNDSTVRQVSERTVLAQTAYLLFYERSAAANPRRVDGAPGKTPKHPRKSERPSPKADAAATDGHGSTATAPLAASDEMEAALGDMKLQLNGSKKKKHRKSKSKSNPAPQDAAPNSERPSTPIESNPGSATNPPVAAANQSDAQSASKLDTKLVDTDVTAETESLEWVVNDKPKTPKKPASSTAPVVAWNEDAASKRAKAAAVLAAKSSSEWSVADVRADRTSQYGAHVESWAGGTSTTGVQAKPKKRSRHPDNYDSEYDRGRVKKTKKNKRNKFAATVNPFQILSERQSKQKR
ncbi:hypothetical protein H4S01_003053 [Coemansia sp. RSA 2610]|nr:hypothetical protein H4S01_003053 [Coemansia sp. RSA 2610]